jgi:hypothetical protein
MTTKPKRAAGRKPRCAHCNKYAANRRIRDAAGIAFMLCEGCVPAFLDARPSVWVFDAGYKNPHAVALGRKGGKVKSEAKTNAAKINGAKGGRPRGK